MYRYVSPSVTVEDGTDGVCDGSSIMNPGFGGWLENIIGRGILAVREDVEMLTLM
jgi:hypothetical protein